MKKRIIAIFAVVALLLTLLAIPVFADNDLEPDMNSSQQESNDLDDGQDNGQENDLEPDMNSSQQESNDLDDGQENEQESEKETETETTPAPEPEKTEEKKELSAETIGHLILGGIVLAIVVALIVVFFFLPKRREKTLKFFRSLKSEWKKISWYSWKQTWKGTLVVAIVSIVIAIVVGLLDTGFTEGIKALADLF